MMDRKTNPVTTLPIIFTVIGLIVAFALMEFFFLPKSAHQTALIVGIVMAAIGAALRLISQANLGRNFSHEVKIKSDHKLVTNGIHSLIRHPMYTGMYFLVVGLTIAMQSYIASIVGTIALIALGIFRVKIEEETLQEKFGMQYIEYKKRTKNFIPFIW